MKSIILIALALLVAAPCFAADADLKSISEAGITVWYAPKYEAQAKQVLALARTSIAPSVDIHRQISSLTSEAPKLAADITSVLGCEELTEKTKVRLLTYKDKSEALVQIFSNIRLVESADAVAKGGIDAGVLQVRYDDVQNDFPMTLNLPVKSPDVLKRSFFPVFINADGRIRSENKIPEFAIAQLGTNKAMILAPIHEAAHHLLTDELGLYHPFARWFDEGVSGWVAKRISLKYRPELKKLAEEMFSVSAGSKKREDDLNLLAWPQAGFQLRSARDFDPILEAAQTQYSIQLISDLLGGNRGGELAKIMLEVKYKGNPDTDTICQAVKNVTHVDLKAKLQKYVPARVRMTDRKRTLALAEKLTLDKKWPDAAGKLKAVLEQTPDDVNSRLNLAWVDREYGERADSELQVFIAAALLRQKQYSFHLFAPSLEGNYVLARLAILVGNLETARKFLEPVLQADPKHEDALRALAQIRQMEGTVK